MANGSGNKGAPFRAHTEFAQLVRSIEKQMEEFTRPIREAQKAQSFPEFLFADIFENHRRDERIAKAGWFPHPVLPLAGIDAVISEGSATVDDFVREYVCENWATIRESIVDSPAFPDVDTEHKETLRQAVVAHEQQLYRCVPRTMFGEIEMASRQVLKGVPLDNAINAGLKPVLKELGNMPIPALPTDLQTGALYGLLTGHIYHDSRHRETEYGIPNRHDHMHGYKGSHAGFRDSFNMLLLSEVMFRILATFVKMRVDEDS